MNPKVKKLISVLFIVISVSAVIVIAFSNQEMGDAWGAISRLDIRWLGCIFLCWFAYVLFEAAGTWVYLKRQGFQINLPRVFGSTLIGIYYSNITPGAAGGQPMQVNSLRKAGIPVGYGSLVITVRLVTNQFMVCLLSLVLFLLNRDFVYAQLGGAMWAVRIGWLINFASVPLILSAAFCRKAASSTSGTDAKLISQPIRAAQIASPSWAYTSARCVRNSAREIIQIINWFVTNRIVSASVPWATDTPALCRELTCIGCPPAALGVILL